ncbi:MAG TPA: hypothetical protein VJR89_37280, partial [Polyangiales bacterium]|nr:hypothetical protein [Polyangiales bacterium]
MTKPSIGALLGALTILVPGGIATVVVLRTLPVYWGRDLPATVIVLAIALALLLGLAELFVRQQIAQQLERELRTLPTRPREATLDIASPRLAALLRARLEYAPAAAIGDGITPFLTGLLVMLGLLGTLLGLYQTVQGAGHALTASANVAALRQSLSGPIAGLTRSFGCSAAGICASAMLGLALALVRRREAHTARAVHAYAAGPLRTFSANARQLRAIEQLANQGTALPAAAGAIASVGEKLGELTTQLLALQQTALDSQERALRELIGSVPGELARAATETGQALHTHVSPLLDQLAARSGEALAAQSSALSGI